MTLKNRVDPSGRLHAISARGTLMGNRGNLCIPGEDGPKIHRHANGRRWIICVTHYRYQVLPLATANNNTQLFFLDEPTALAAGHRPCARCRRDAYRAYLQSWTKAFPDSDAPDADAIDFALHQERNLTASENRTYAMPLAQVPDGALVRWQHQPTLVYRGWLQHWSFAGYTPIQRIAAAADAAEVPVLTPPSNLATLSAGYVPLVHPTAHGGS